MLKLEKLLRLYGRPRGLVNPIFGGGIGEYNGVVLHEQKGISMNEEGESDDEESSESAEATLG
jgi:hypothetical protein